MAVGNRSVESAQVGTTAGAVTHIAHTMIQVLFRADRVALERLLPAPLEPTEDSDQGLAAVLDTIVQIDSGHPRQAGAQPRRIEPERQQFMEAYIAVPCQYEGIKGRYFPYLWVDRPRGAAAPGAGGYFIKLGEMAITRINPTHARLNYIGPGMCLGGALSRSGRRVLEVGIELTRKGAPHDIALHDYNWNTYGLRYFPDLEGGPPLVHQLLRGRTPNRYISELWHGHATLELLPASNEDVHLLNPIDVIAGHYVTFGYSNVGSVVVHDYLRPGCGAPGEGA